MTLLSEKTFHTSELYRFNAIFGSLHTKDWRLILQLMFQIAG